MERGYLGTDVDKKDKGQWQIFWKYQEWDQVVSEEKKPEQFSVRIAH